MESKHSRGPIRVLAALAVILASTAAGAQPARYGPRLGFSIDPDQFTFGAYLGTTDLRPGLRGRPSVDLGLGDNVLTILINADVEYRFEDKAESVLPFAGGGLALGFFNFDVPEGVSDDTATEIGINVYGGVEKDLGGFKTGMVEARVGIFDVPTFKITAALGFF